MADYEDVAANYDTRIGKNVFGENKKNLFALRLVNKTKNQLGLAFVINFSYKLK